MKKADICTQYIDNMQGHDRTYGCLLPDTVILGRYVILESIGAGSGGNVYLVHDLKLDKKWALKMVRLLSDNELTLLKRVSHPAFPRIVDTLSYNNSTGIVMDYIPGVTLSEYSSVHAMTADKLYMIALELGDAIGYLHSITPAILYMDCKPDNIIMGDDSHLHLIDLGSSYITDSDADQRISGTLPYASPEARAGGKVDTRSDIYAYGMTLFSLMQAPIKIPGITERLIRRVTKRKDMTALSHIIRRCIETSPEKRYQSMSEVLHHLNNPRLIGYGIHSLRECVYRFSDYLCKQFLALFSILSFHVYAQNMQLPYLFLGMTLFALLYAMSGRTKALSTAAIWKCNRDIFLGNMTTLLPVILLCMLLTSIDSHATPATPETDIRIYDGHGNLMLYKGQYVQCDGDNLYLCIPAASISPEHIPARIEVY